MVLAAKMKLKGNDEHRMKSVPSEASDADGPDFDGQSMLGGGTLGAPLFEPIRPIHHIVFVLNRPIKFMHPLVGLAALKCDVLAPGSHHHRLEKLLLFDAFPGVFHQNLLSALGPIWKSYQLR
jgi:hypothetical protein